MNVSRRHLRSTLVVAGLGPFMLIPGCSGDPEKAELQSKLAATQTQLAATEQRLKAATAGSGGCLGSAPAPTPVHDAPFGSPMDDTQPMFPAGNDAGGESDNVQAHDSTAQNGLHGPSNAEP